MKFTLLFVIVPIVIAVYIVVAPPLPWTPIRIVGAAIAVVSLVLISAARMQLGNAFSIRPKAVKLVTTGLYSKIRNPVYFYGCTFIVGLALYWKPIALMTLLIIIPMQIARAKAESNVLEQAFGDEYRRWKAQTWF
jgi:protein-S-isoprenylcysteine O-methyltransferase Ste14